MSAPRLLVVADPKMLPALASGLREGGAFEVIGLPFSDLAAVAQAAEGAQALLLFYGAPEKGLPSVLELLAAPLRKRGASVVAVLHKDTSAQRDDCFRAGASDVLFMPMPKDTFRLRLVASVGLLASDEPGLSCGVSVVEGQAEPRPLEGALVSLSGVRGKGLAAAPGSTVRLSVQLAGGPLQVWGLVAPAQGETSVVRFAGLSQEEDLRLREFLKIAGVTAPPPPLSRPPVPVASAVPLVTPTASPRAVPVAGPPPGFAERPPIRPQTPHSLRTPPVMAVSGSLPPPPSSIAAAPSAPAAASTSPSPVSKAIITPAPGSPPVAASAAQVAVVPEAGAQGVVVPAPDAQASVEQASVVPGPAVPGTAGAAAVEVATAVPAKDALSALFDESSNPAVSALPAAPEGPLWPGPIDLELCKTAVAQMIKDRQLPTGAPPDLAAAARRVAGGLSSVEREALALAGPDSHLYEALHARMALALANTSARHLFSSQPPAVVGAPSLGALVLLGDSAAKRLQAEADKAIAKGEVEALQMITATSAALSREQLALKETADQLRGVAAGPRLGAGSLDPDFQLAGQQPKAVARRDPKLEEKQQARAELRDFVGLEDTPKAERSRKALYIGLGVLALSLANVLWFSHPGARPASQALLERAGVGVVSISVADKTAIVTVTKGWLVPERRADALKTLCDALASAGIHRAALIVDGAGTAGQVDVKSDCTPWGLPGGKPGSTPPTINPTQPAPSPVLPPPGPHPGR